METILLRFRDFGADSIQEHQKLIAEIGFVWWGWWKKSEEPDRSRELEKLRARLQTGVVEIGLFDRSEERYFIATVSECAHRSNSERISSPSPTTTPHYYRREKLPAWFKLTYIEALRNVDVRFRDLFRSIPIGDKTFYEVGEPGLSNLAESQEDCTTIPVRGHQVLHLSDIHFGEFAFPGVASPGSYPLDRIIVDDLEKLAAKVGIVVVSGDFTTRADGNRLFSEALPFLNALREKLRLTHEQVVMVPGNHDIPLRDHDPINYQHEATYLTFQKEFYGKKSEIMRLQCYEMEGGVPVEVLTMNSVRLREKDQSNYGYVEWPLYESLLKSRPVTHPSTLRVGVLHHHIVPAPREEGIDPKYPDAAMSMTLDAGSIIEGLQNHNFQLALNGHQHIPRLTTIARGRLQDSSADLVGLDTPLHVLGAGSVGASRLFPEMRDNTYNLLTIERINDDLRVNVRVRRFNAGTQPKDHMRYTLHL